MRCNCREQSDATAMRQVSDEEIEKLCAEFNFNAWTEMSVKDNVMVDDSMRFIVSCIINQEKTQHAKASTGDSHAQGMRLGTSATSTHAPTGNKCSC